MPFADNLHSSARTEPSHQALLSGPAGHRHRTGLGGIRQSANVANSWARPNQFEPDWTCWTNFLNIFQSSTALSSEMLWGSDIEDVSVPPANEPSSGPGTPIPGRRLTSNCWTVLPLECSRPPSNAHTHRHHLQFASQTSSRSSAIFLAYRSGKFGSFGDIKAESGWDFKRTSPADGHTTGRTLFGSGTLSVTLRSQADSSAAQGRQQVQWIIAESYFFDSIAASISSSCEPSRSWRFNRISLLNLLRLPTRRGIARKCEKTERVQVWSWRSWKHGPCWSSVFSPSQVIAASTLWRLCLQRQIWKYLKWSKGLFHVYSSPWESRFISDCLESRNLSWFLSSCSQTFPKHWIVSLSLYSAHVLVDLVLQALYIYCTSTCEEKHQGSLQKSSATCQLCIFSWEYSAYWVAECFLHRTGLSCPQPVLRIHNCLNLCQSIVPWLGQEARIACRIAWPTAYPLAKPRIQPGGFLWLGRMEPQMMQDAIQCEARFGPWNLSKEKRMLALSVTFTRESGVTKSKKYNPSFSLRWQPYFLDGRFGTCTSLTMSTAAASPMTSIYLLYKSASAPLPTYRHAFSKTERRDGVLFPSSVSFLWSVIPWYPQFRFSSPNCHLDFRAVPQF